MFLDSGAHSRPLAAVEGTGCRRQEGAGKGRGMDLVETVVNSVSFEESTEQLEVHWLWVRERFLQL